MVNEFELKKQICEIGRRIYNRNMVAANDGNISVKLNDNEFDYLNKEKDIHWWEYNELISGLTNESILNKIRDLRTYDISDIKDEKERKRIINAKNRVALKINEVKSDKEKEIDKIWDNILN